MAFRIDVAFLAIKHNVNLSINGYIASDLNILIK